MARPAFFIAALALSSGCAFHTGTDYRQRAADDTIVDLRPAKLGGQHGLIRPGMTRDQVDSVVERLKLEKGRINARWATYVVRGTRSEFVLLGPHGGGPADVSTWYNFTVEYNEEGRVVGTEASVSGEPYR